MFRVLLCLSFFLQTTGLRSPAVAGVAGATRRLWSRPSLRLASVANEELAPVPVQLEQELGDSFLQYAMSIILGRALPDARDGMKPVHRRILYAMHVLNLGPASQHRKCARVVGEVLGKFHPHGDTAVYEALVRMAQSWVMSGTLIDGHGNFGSLDNDPPAAMRYTECRLTPLATDALLKDIREDTVDFLPNFDASEEEPVVLPARLPMLLLNGANGIAVGMATNMPPHNLGELVDAMKALVADPDLPDDELYKIVPGPDFPTGGYILGMDGARNLYNTGKGSITMRAKTHLEKIQGPRRSTCEAIVVTELPYMTNKSLFLSRTAGLVNDKELEGVSDLRDESDRDGMRIVIELKKGAVPTVVENNLMKRTQMQYQFNGNMLAIGKDGKKPLRLGLREALQEFIKFRFQTVRRRTQFQLAKLEARNHIVEGLQIALERIDDVIDVLRKASDSASAKTGLVDDLGMALSGTQMDAILDLRLSRLTSLETKKLNEEQKDLSGGIQEARKLLDNDADVYKMMVQEWDELKAKYGVARRSQILMDEEATIDLKEEDLLANDRSVIVLTSGGYIKRMPVDEFNTIKRGSRGKAGAQYSKRDAEGISQFFACNDHDTILFITDKGIAHAIRAFQVPFAGRTARGSALPSIMPLTGEDKIAGVVTMSSAELEDEEQFLVMITRNGWIKKTPLSSMKNINSRGLTVQLVESGDALLRVRRCTSEDSVVVATAEGSVTRFSTDNTQLRATSRKSRGVKSIKTREQDKIVDLEVMSKADSEQGSSLLIVTQNGYGKRVKIENFRKQARGGVGVRAIKFKTKKSSNGDDKVACCRIVRAGAEVMLTTAKGTIVRQSGDLISQQQRQSTGVALQRLDPGDAIVEIAVVPDEDLQADERAS
mmetsp:Transcript_12460/g.46094  ORF Transcript_12460/g.46094 Transcript_12460/m.46094 type:complete len:888 (-) Transcript_12460:369-3032(-)|eukprot:scaffold438_cov250-Pinguiococcus_pyrenoidosus.AAC.20